MKSKYISYLPVRNFSVSELKGLKYKMNKYFWTKFCTTYRHHLKFLCSVAKEKFGLRKFHFP